MTTEEREPSLKRVLIIIKRVLELEGLYDPNLRADTSAFAHTSAPVDTPEGLKQRVLLALFPQHGLADLGTINPETCEFKPFDPKYLNPAIYERSDNHVICSMNVPVDQVEKLPTLDQLLTIPGIRVGRDLRPE